MSQSTQFAWTSRLLHWSMAVLLLAMVFIGVSMVTSLTDYRLLVTIHRPLGIAILVLAIVRVVNRRLRPPPDFPPSLSRAERRWVTLSELGLYTFMFALPLVGWGMLSAGGNPVTLAGSFTLPPIAPKSPTLFATLRTAHTVLAYLFFVTFLAHLAGVLFHAIVLRDRLFLRMAPWRAGAKGEAPSGSAGAQSSR